MRGYHTTAAVMAEYAYDHLGRVTDIAAGTGVNFHYDYVANENNIWKKRFDHRNGSPYNEYSYDDIDRLAGVTYLDSETEGFVMDDLGNRVGNQTLRGDGSVNFAVDALTNRYTSVGGNSLAYDDAGNLTRDKDGYVYGYDYENRIVEIRNSADAVIAKMDYDTQGRRVRVNDAAAGTETLYYYSDKWQVLAEYTPSGTQQAYYVYGNYIDEVLLMHRAGADVFYLHDHLFSPVALLNPAGAVVERYEYNAYGKASILAFDFSPLSSSAYGNHILFTGREVDDLDNGSLQIMHYRHRAYDTYAGRFMQHDPMGINPSGKQYNQFNIIQENISNNKFEYVKSNPIYLLDALGLREYEYGNGWPAKPLPQWHINQVKEIAATYNIWERNLDNLKERLHTTAEVVAAIGWANLNGWDDAAEFLSHFKGNTGSTHMFIGKEFISEDSLGKDRFIDDLNSAMSFVDSGPISQFRAKNWINEIQCGSPNWQNALGDYRTFAFGTPSYDQGWYHMRFVYLIRDVYYWELGKMTGADTLLHDDLARMHRYGEMKMFEVESSHNVTVKWKKGQRIGSGAILTEY